MRSPLLVVGLSLLLLLVLIAAAPAATRGTVIEVIDGDTIRVQLKDRVETVRLIGIDTPELGAGRRTVEHLALEARRFVTELALERDVRLETDPVGDTRDAYGRALRYVFVEGDRLLNAEILKAGYAHATTRFPFSRSAEFVEWERQARGAEHGLWKAEELPRIAAERAGEHVGQRAVVCGRVGSTRYLAESRGRPTFINLGPPYPNQHVTVVIWGSDRRAFGEPEVAWRDQELCVRGTVETYRGKPQIVARLPEDVERR